MTDAKKLHDEVTEGNNDSWYRIQCNRFIDEVENLSNLLHVSMHGIKILQGMPEIIEIVTKLEQNRGEVDEVRATDRRERAEKEAGLARAESDNNFPLLHAQALVTLWTLLEAAVTNFLENFLKNRPDATKSRTIQELKISIAEYEANLGDDRFGLIVDKLEKETCGDTRYGYERFECLLKPFGLSGHVPTELRKTLLECSQVRNCIVHRFGKVDRQLLKSCPWLPYKNGDSIVVSHKMYARYMDASLTYICMLYFRACKLHGLDKSKDIDELIEKWSKPPTRAD